MTDPARCIPVLASLDLAQTLRFYRDELGFEGAWADNGYAIVRRDAMELHFWRTRDPAQPAHTSCYVRGEQVPALYPEYAARDVPGLSCFEVKP